MAALGILLIAFGLMLGILTKQQASRKIGRTLIMVGLIPLLISFVQGSLAGLPTAQRYLATAAVLIIGVAVCLRLVMGKELFRQIIGSAIYDILKVIVLAPFRLLGRLRGTR